MSHALKLASLSCAIVLSALSGGAQPVTKVTGGYGHSLFLKSDGSLWAMGFNNLGQLGDGTVQATNRPEQIVVSNVTAIAAGQYHSLFITNGALWGMGYNGYGQLGDGTHNNTNRPEQIVATNVTAIAAGERHSLFLKSDGSLWAMGYDFHGELGDGATEIYTNKPEQIVASNVTAIAAGAYHSLFLKSDGSLWAMGENIYGQSGIGTFTTNAPYGTNRPQEIVPGNVTAIAAKGYHSLFLKNDGSLWAMGYNIVGQLGDGTTNNVNQPELIVASNVTAIAAGEYHSLFLKKDGSLWAMGDQEYGELGDGIFATNVPYGTNQPEQILANNVTVIGAGYLHSLFLKSDGSLWGMGLNAYGELGDGISYVTFSGLNGTNRPEQILAVYNQMAIRQLSSGDVQLSFVGVAGANYALDRSTSLSPPNWIPQATNPASSFGPLVITNTPDASRNNFWRIRSVP